MITFWKTHRIRPLLIILAAVAVAIMLITLRQSAFAQPGGQGQLTITEVTVGAPAPDLLRIVGRNLDNGPSLNVTLGEFPGSLSIVSATSTQIIADLPVNLPGGDYLLSVSTGSGSSRRDVYDLTVGGPDGVPVGSIILWVQSSNCPDGFARVAAYDGRFLVGGNSPGNTGGSNTHSHDAGTYTAPSHRHSLEPWDHAQSPVDDNSGGTDFNARTGIADGGTMTGSSGQADSRPEFTTIVLCRKI